MSHYDTLNVARDATQDEIKSAFRRAARAAHPDREGGDTEQMARVNRAYQVLGDPAARAQYDQTGEEPAPPNDPGLAVLVQLFERAITECDGDVLAFCHRELDQAISSLKDDENSVRRQLQKLIKKRDCLKTKDGRTNLFASMVDHKVTEQEAQLRSIASGEKSAQLAKDHLASYESTFVPEPSSTMDHRQKDHNLDALIAEMQRGMFGKDFGRRSGRFF